MQAFEHVCPDRVDLIHKNYRRLCNLLVDIDEWGQVTVLSMLTRYARSQFIDPNKVKFVRRTNLVRIDRLLVDSWGWKEQFLWRWKKWQSRRWRRWILRSTNIRHGQWSSTIVTVYETIAPKPKFSCKYQAGSRKRPTRSTLTDPSIVSGCHGCCATLLLRGTSQWSSSGSEISHSFASSSPVGVCLVLCSSQWSPF